MKSRSFQLDNEWNMIHYPDRPKGFGILIIGDERHFVDEKSSFWIQNEGKAAFITALQEAGYTIFYSNLYGRHWGSDAAVKLAKRLYEYVFRTEIINRKIHLIAEGMGALAAMKLFKEMEEDLRSVVLLNPVLSLKEQLLTEKEHVFFYKRMLKELSRSYGIEKGQVLEKIQAMEEAFQICPRIPVKIFHVLAGRRAYKLSEGLKKITSQWKEADAPVTVRYYVPEKKPQIPFDVIKFFSKHETVL